jgi:hypothetical protein
MLQLSIENEIKAREKYNLCDFTTLFLVEYGSDAKTKELVKNYPYDAKYIVRDKKYGLTINILEGMKAAFDMAEDFVIHLEDDVLLHEDYFLYMKALMDLVVDKYSVLSPYYFDDCGDVHEVNKHNHYAALSPVISKHFFENYIKICANDKYYRNPAKFVIGLNNQFKQHWKSRKYKYTDACHYEQAGLLNRLADVAVIEEDLYIYMPRVNRQQHIGYFGKNRPGGKLPGKNYEERLSNLRKIILDAKTMYDLSATKQYSDYKVFSPKLEQWDGTLTLKGYKGTCKDGK